MELSKNRRKIGLYSYRQIYMSCIVLCIIISGLVSADKGDFNQVRTRNLQDMRQYRHLSEESSSTLSTNKPETKIEPQY
jgi:hypothetical protein